MQKIGRTKYERNGIKFINYVLHLAGSQLFVDDTAEITVDSLHDKSKLWVEQKNVKLIIIDYGQLIKEFLPYGDKNRLFERLRDSAMELNVPIVVLFQFTRRTRQVSYESDFVRIQRLRASLIMWAGINNLHRSAPFCLIVKYCYYVFWEKKRSKERY